MFILIGQIMIGAVFFIAAIGDIFDYKFLLSLLAEKKVPYRKILLPGAILLKMICGLALIFSVLVPLAAFLLAGFTLIANVIFNNFWRLMGAGRKQAYIQFLVHFGIIGGLIILIGR